MWDEPPQLTGGNPRSDGMITDAKDETITLHVSEEVGYVVLRLNDAHSAAAIGVDAVGVSELRLDKTGAQSLRDALNRAINVM